MSSKCGGCGRYISAAEAARCHKCCASYHRRCVALPVAGSVSPTWQCPKCKKNRVTDNRADTPVRGTVGNCSNASHRSPTCKGAKETSAPSVQQSPSQSTPTTDASHIAVTETTEDLKSDIAAELIIFRNNLRSINEEMRLFKDEIADIRASLHMCTSNLDKLENRVSELEKRGSIEKLVDDDTITQLKQHLNDRDQELLANDVEVVNLPEITGENTLHVTMTIAAKLGIQIDERDIVSAERVGPRHLVSTDAAGPERRPRPLAVRFTRRALRDELLSSARSRRGATSADLGVAGPPRRFYINERLTKQNRQLFRRVRDVSERHGWKFVWCKHGRILVRNKPGDRAICIRSDIDIESVFGPSI